LPAARIQLANSWQKPKAWQKKIKKLAQELANIRGRTVWLVILEEYFSKFSPRSWDRAAGIIVQLDVV
tara:strand:+ start:1303 stop:1506 length:204 start_codon:yes stop_codon:yes gene_type:complete